MEKWKIYYHWKNISSNQLFSDFVSKNIVFTKFLPKKCESEFLQIPQCAYQIVKLVQLLTVLFMHKELFRFVFLRLFSIYWWLERLFTKKVSNITDSTKCNKSRKLRNQTWKFTVKTSLVDFTEFLQKKLWVNFCNFYTVCRLGKIIVQCTW